MSNQRQYRAMIGTARQAMELLKAQLDAGKWDQGLLMDLQALVTAGAGQAGSPAPQMPLSAGEAEIRVWMEAVLEWQDMVLRQAEKPAPPRILNETDKTFYGMMESIEEKTIEELSEQIKHAFMGLKKEYREFYADYLRRFPYWGQWDPRKKDYSIIENRAQALVEHREDFLWLYGRLYDYRSKNTLLAILCSWCDYDTDRLRKTREIMFGDYFDCDIIPYGRDEVFADLGAYIGDTALEYMKLYGGCKKMYCYEITEDSYEKLKRNTSQYSQIECRKKGVSDRCGTMYISKNGDLSANMLTDNAANKAAVEVVALDKDIQEPVTFIKMDIEGSEQAALRGAAEHIRRSHPKLAICTYHNNEDIWKIPRMIDEIQPGYRFYMRHNGGDLIPSEYVLLALWKGIE